jgi:hypothetical protein
LYAPYALWGTAIGAVIGLGVGTYSYRNNNSGCNDCWVSPKAVIPFGAVAGAATGFLTGSFLHLLARSTPSPRE